MDKYKDTWIESTRSFEMRDCWYHYKEGRNWISFKAILYKLEWIVCYVFFVLIMVNLLYIWFQFFISISRKIHLFMWKSNSVVILCLLRSFLFVLYNIRHWWVWFSAMMIRYFMYSASLALHIFWIVISYVMKQCVKRNKCFQ